MLAVLGEHRSDVNTLKVIVRRWLDLQRLRIRHRDFGGAGGLVKHGAGVVQSFSEMGVRAFVICHDADGPNEEHVRRKIQEQVVARSKVPEKSCGVVIPVQELEAWILADIESVSKIIRSWTPSPVAHPENIPSPKEYLERLSRDKKRKARYDHAVHNEVIAQHLDLAKVHKRCQSFRPLTDFLDANRKAFAK